MTSPAGVLEVVELQQHTPPDEVCQWRAAGGPPACDKPVAWLAMMMCCGESRLWCEPHRAALLARPPAWHRCRCCGARGTVEDLMMWIPYERGTK